MKLEGKVSLVTGSSQALVKGLLYTLPLRASVVIDYRSHPEGAETWLKVLQAAGGKCYLAQCPQRMAIIKADLERVNDVRRMIAASIEHFRKLTSW